MRRIPGLFAFALLWATNLFAYDNEVTHQFTVTGRAASFVRGIFPNGQVIAPEFGGDDYDGDDESGSGYFVGDQIAAGRESNVALRTASGLEAVRERLRNGTPRKLGTLGVLDEDNPKVIDSVKEDGAFIEPVPSILDAGIAVPRLSMSNHFFVQSGMGIPTGLVSSGLPMWYPWARDPNNLFSFQTLPSYTQLAPIQLGLKTFLGTTQSLSLGSLRDVLGQVSAHVEPMNALNYGLKIWRDAIRLRVLSDRLLEIDPLNSEGIERREQAWFQFGRALHLLEDMGSVPHVYGDAHMRNEKWGHT